ncbi:MAG: hypothetical protein GYB67_11605 [Chloroflexi bacterium]|nr:hypothetical protein [Chloroflexota bacterium]
MSKARLLAISLALVAVLIAAAIPLLTRPPQAAPSTDNVIAGFGTFRDRGCTSCHDDYDSDDPLPNPPGMIHAGNHPAQPDTQTYRFSGALWPTLTRNPVRTFQTALPVYLRQLGS